MVLPIDSTQAPIVVVPPIVVPEDSTVMVCAPVVDANPADTHTVITCGGPDNGTGTTTINNNTDEVCITYEPNQDFTGTDSICIIVCDQTGLCDTTTITIEVLKINDGPVAIDDIVTTQLNIPIIGNVLTNDEDIDGEILMLNTTPISPIGGIAVIQPTGEYTFTPTPDFVGEATFQYEICDGGNPILCDTATVVIEVIDNTDFDNNQILGLEDNFTTETGSPLSGNLLGNDSDPDGDNLMINPMPISVPTTGTLTINSDGTFIYTTAPDFTGQENFAYEVCDVGTPQSCDTVMVTIEVLNNDGKNDLYATDDASIAEEGQTQSGNLIDNDNDPENGALIVDTTPVSEVSNGTLILNPDGSYSYEPNPGFIGNDRFLYSVCDDGTPVACDTASVYLTVLEPRIFDLAIMNRLAPRQATTVLPGYVVDYEIVVINQGNIDAYDIEVVNYLPDGLSFDLAENGAAYTNENRSGSRSVNNWSLESGIPTFTIEDLAELDSIIINISLTVNDDFRDTNITSFVEITYASNQPDGPNRPDIDSHADRDQNNDFHLLDGMVNGNGNMGEDEDDHDGTSLKIIDIDDIVIIGDTTITTIDPVVTDTITDIDPEATPVFEEELEEVDCSQFSISCYHGLAIELMPIGMVEIHASDISVNDFSNCPEYKLGIWHDSMPMKEPTTLTEVKALPSTLIFTCATLDIQEVHLYVIDPEGKWNLCKTYIDVQDNNTACTENQVTDTTLALIGGQVNTWKGTAVEEVLFSTTQADYMTTQDGFYHFELPMEKAYTVTPQKNHNPLNGVSTYDLVLMTKHILGIQTFDNPYQWIAADVNQSKTITAFDLVQLRKLILAIDTEFANNTSWRFVEADYDFTTASPITEDFPEQAQIDKLSGNKVMNFIAVKIGDINGNVKANSLQSLSERSSPEVFELQIEDIELKRGQSYQIPVSTQQINQIQGYQFTMVFGELKIDKLEGKLMKLEHFGLQEKEKGRITTSWNHRANSKVLQEEDQEVALFTIEIMAMKDVKLSEVMSIDNEPTKAEAYDEAGNTMAVQFKFEDPLLERDFDLYQNTPNPFSEQTTIGFYLPGDSAIEFIVRDETGRILRTLEEERKAGYNTIQIEKAGLINGFMYYQIATKYGTKSKKMLRLN